MIIDENAVTNRYPVTTTRPAYGRATIVMLMVLGPWIGLLVWLWV